LSPRSSELLTIDPARHDSESVCPADCTIDVVLSVEEVGVYKPSPEVYALAARQLDLLPGEIGFVSANSWDAHGAGAFGFRVAWCNRTGQPPERLPGAPEVEVRSLSDLPAFFAR
jgi:2-haloacid dehalogenase